MASYLTIEPDNQNVNPLTLYKLEEDWQRVKMSFPLKL